MKSINNKYFAIKIVKKEEIGKMLQTDQSPESPSCKSSRLVQLRRS